MTQERKLRNLKCVATYLEVNHHKAVAVVPPGEITRESEKPVQISMVGAW